MDPEKKKQKQLKEKNFKDFIKMRRKQMKNLVVQEKAIDALKELMVGNNADKFKEAILSENFQTVYNFLFSEDEVRVTPLIHMIKEDQWLEYLEAVGEWSISCIPSPLPDKQKDMMENQLTNHMMNTKFLNFNRALIPKVLTFQIGSTQIKKLINILSEKSSLYEMLYESFGNLENLLLIIQEEKRIDALNNFYLRLFTSLQQVATKKSIERYLNQLKKQVVWKKQNFEESLEEPNLLILKELNFNFLHQLVLKRQINQIIKIDEHIEEISEENLKTEQLKNEMFCIFDSGKETPFDIILRHWNYGEIEKFLQHAQGKEGIIPSVNCLNKILQNKKLSQKETQSLIEEFLRGTFSHNGFAEDVLKTSKRKAEFHNSSGSFIITFERNKVLMAKQGNNSFPLRTYLAKYGEKCDLKIIQMLFFKAIERKSVKKVLVPFLEVKGPFRSDFTEDNEGLDKINQIINYFQALWIQVCKLPHGDLFEYFLNKLYINYFEMVVHRLRAKGQICYVVLPVEKHFLVNYIDLHKDLTENALNLKIYKSIMECKENEKNINSFKLYYQLLKQYKKYQRLRKSQEWLPKQIKQDLKNYFKSFSPERYLKQYSIYFNCNLEARIQILATQLEALFNKEQIIERVKSVEHLVQYFDDEKMNTPEMEEKFKGRYQETQQIKQFFLKKSLRRRQVSYVTMIQDLCEVKSLSLPNLFQKYKVKKTFENFSNYIEKAVVDYESQEQKPPADKLIYGNKYLFKGIFGFQTNEEDLVEKAKKMIELGYDFYFKMNRAEVTGSSYTVYNKFADDFDEPYKSLFKNMIRLRQKTKSCSFMNSIFCCEDDMADLHFQFIKKLPVKFRKELMNKKIQNVFILSKLLSESELLNQFLPLYEQNERDRVFDVVRRIGLEMKGEAMAIQRKNLANQSTESHYSRLRARFQLCKKHIQPLFPFRKYEGYNVINQFLLCHNPQKCDLSQFYRKISGKFLGPCLDFRIFANALIASEKPVIVYKQLKESLFQICKEYKKDNEDDEIFDNANKILYVYEGSGTEYREGAPLFSTFYNSLSVSDFQQIIQIPEEQKSAQIQIKNLLKGISNEDIAQSAFDIMLNNKLLVNANDSRIYLKSNCPLYNASVFAFVLPSIRGLIEVFNESGESSHVELYQYPIKCQRASFERLVTYLNKMLAYELFEEGMKVKKIEAIVSALFKDQNWERIVLLINRFESSDMFWKVLIKCLFDFCGKNIESAQRYEKKQDYLKGIDRMFQILAEKMKGEFEKEVFIHGFWIDADKIVKAMKPKAVDIVTLARCLHKRPQHAPLIRSAQISLDFSQCPEKYSEVARQNIFPLSTYSAYEFNSSPWLIDLLLIEIELENGWKEKAGDEIKQYTAQLKTKKKAVFLVKEVMNNFQRLYTENEIKEYSNQVFHNTHIQSLKQVPKEYIDAYFSHYNRIKNIRNLKQSMILELIEMGYLKDDYIQDILKCSKMNVFEKFISKNCIKLSADKIVEIEQKHLKGKFLIQILLAISDEDFIITFLKKYGLIELYIDIFPKISRIILIALAQFQQTKVLQYLLKWVRSKFGQFSFEEAQDENSYIDTENKIIKLPVDTGAATSFYQYFFLLQSSKKLCSKFSPSTRFFINCDPQKFQFLPEMARRLKLLNIVSENLKKGKDLDFHVEVLFPSVIEIPFVGEKKKQNQGFWMESLEKLLKFAVRGKIDIPIDCQHLAMPPEAKIRNLQQLGIFQKILILKVHPEVQIPEDRIQKWHETENNLVNKVINLCHIDISGFQQCQFMFEKDDELKEIIFQHSPKYFLQNFEEDFSRHPYAYTKGVLTNLKQLEAENEGILFNFIEICFFNEMKPLEPGYSGFLLKDLFLICLVSKYEGSGSAINQVMKLFEQQMIEKDSGDEMLFTLAMVLNKRGEDYIFDGLLWNKMHNDLKEIESIKGKFSKAGNYSTFISTAQTYKSIFLNTKAILQKVVSGLPDIYACLTTLANAVQLFSEGNSIMNELKVSGLPSSIQKIYAVLEQAQNKSIDVDGGNIKVYCSYSLSEEQPMLKYVHADGGSLVRNVSRHFYLQKLDEEGGLLQIEGRGLGKMTFVADVESFREIDQLATLKRLLEESLMSNDGITLIKRELDKLATCTKPDSGVFYSLSDVYGPIAINDQTDKSAVSEALSFYEYCELPEYKAIVKYTKTRPEGGAKAMCEDIKQYLKFFTYEINSDQDQNPDPYSFHNIIYLTTKPQEQKAVKLFNQRRENQQTIMSESVKVIWDWFHPSNVTSFIEGVNYYGTLLTHTFENLVNVKFSIPSVFKLVESSLAQLETTDDVLKLVHGILGEEASLNLTEKILMMVLEDATNIMKVVKGIVISFNYDENLSLTAGKKPYKLTADFCVYHISYKITEQVFTIMFEGSRHHPSASESLEECQLISRKEFLHMIFSSTEFLTDYFLDKTKLTQETVKISTNISKIVNSTTNVLINYRSLYGYIDVLKEQITIKQIDSYLYELRHYIMSNLQKVINNYLTSREITVHHQILLLNTFEMKKNGMSEVSEVYGARELRYESRGMPRGGLKEVKGYGAGVVNDDSISIKNMFLVQIYKSYFASMVREGMSFILGYKAPGKQPTIIQLQKKEDVDKVSVVELSYMLWITNKIPTNDEISHHKIIRIFIADLNRNVYQIDSEVQEHLLNLPQEHEQRNISELVPIIQPNLTLTFSNKVAMSNLFDNKQSKSLEMNLDENKKFQIKPRPTKPLAAINYLKRDSIFLQMMEETMNFIKDVIPTNFNITVNPPKDADITELNEKIKFVLYDIEGALNNILYEPLRNPQLERYASIEKGQNIQQNFILRKRREFFTQCYSCFSIIFVEEGQSQVLIKESQIKLFISLVKESKSLTCNDIIGAILKNMLERFMSAHEETQELYRLEEKDDNLSKLLDTVIISPYQIEIIKEAFHIARELGHPVAGSFLVSVRSGQKGQLVHEKENNGLLVNIKSDAPVNEFYSTTELLSFIINKHVEVAETTTTTKYIPGKQIIVENYHQVPTAELVIVSADNNITKDQIKINGDQIGNRGTIKPPEKLAKKYYIVQFYNKEYHICSNYFYKFPAIPNSLTNKKNDGLNNQTYTIMFNSPQAVNLIHCPVSFEAVIVDKLTEKKNLTKKFKDIDLEASINLLSNEVMIVNFKTSVTCSINISFGKYRNLLNEGLESCSIDIASSGEIVFENTRFIELQFKNKVHKAKNLNESEHQKKYEVFRQPPEKEIMEEQKVIKDEEAMVYIVNEQAKKYLTRAGEERTDVINFCDAAGNPIIYKGEVNIYFKHIKIQEIYKPNIEMKGVRVELRWTPMIRGPYEVFFNGIRLNPEYEIGIRAAEANAEQSKIELPKVKKLCYAEETECTFELKDSFGNIYTELEESIIGDNIIIDILAGEVSNSIKVKNNPINKYGFKKVRFSIDDPMGADEKVVLVTVQLNKMDMAEFVLEIKGQALSQRRKNLEKDVDKVAKSYYKDVTISRSNFLEGLFKIAEKSLMVNLSIKFSGEQGIDAGGLKRQFYDMIGNEIKSQRNPFFKATDAKKMEYFINPDILKNKKKKQYMGLFGKYLANSITNGYLIGVSFSPVFIKLLYEDPIGIEDLLAVVSKDEAERYKYVLGASQEDFQDLSLDFTAIVDKKKGTSIELKPEGKDIPVTKRNVSEYLELLSSRLLKDRFKEEIESFREGFNSVFDLSIVTRWIRPEEFWSITAGTKDITPEVVINYVVFTGGQEMHNSWFRRYIQQSDIEVLLGFLKFSSGSSSIDFYQTSKVTVRFEKSGGNPKKLPISHTCWKQIIIPAYKTYEIMKQLLNAAFLFCSEGFGFG